MSLFLVSWWVIWGGFSWNVHAAPKSNAKVVEEYVVSAKLDENKNFPQLQQSSQLRGTYQKDGTKALPEPKHAPTSPISYGALIQRHHPADHFHDRNILEERDLLVHHHLPPPSAPPPPPISLHYAPSFFAIGLITFLLLLNSLQTSLLVLKSKGSLLGSVTGALGRRKRFAVESINNYGQRRLNFMPE